MNLQKLRDSMVAQLGKEKANHEMYVDGMVSGVNAFFKAIIEELTAENKANEEAQAPVVDTTAEGVEATPCSEAGPVEGNAADGFFGC